MNEEIKNCAGCKWLDQVKRYAKGEGYCCKVTQSKNYKPGDRARYANMARCELYDAGSFEARHSAMPNSYGAHIDRLRAKYPYRIRRTSEPEYEGRLVGVRPLLGGRETPIYRFPGGDCCEDPNENGIEIIEW